VRRQRALAASACALTVAALWGAGPLATSATADTGVYDPSSPAGSEYADPFERGRSTGGGVTRENAGPGTRADAAPPSRPASAVEPFGVGITPRGPAGGDGTAAAGDRPAAKRRAAERRAAADRVLASREMSVVQSSPVRDVLGLSGGAAVLVLGAAALARLAARRRPAG
jgi:hypothetical protein